MTEEIKYYTGNCITDLHTDTHNKEKCKQYIKSDGLNFCMSSVCKEKDCIYALVDKLHQTIDRLEQENKELKEFCVELERQKQKQHMQWFARCTENHNKDSKIINTYRSALEEINLILDELKQQYDYMADYSEIKEMQDKINEVLNA